MSEEVRRTQHVDGGSVGMQGDGSRDLRKLLELQSGGKLPDRYELVIYKDGDRFWMISRRITCDECNYFRGCKKNGKDFRPSRCNCYDGEQYKSRR